MNRNGNNLAILLQQVVTAGYPVKFPALFFQKLDYLFTVHTKKIYQLRYIVNRIQFITEQVAGQLRKAKSKEYNL